MYSMHGNMRLDYTGEKEHQYWGRFNIRYYAGDWYNIPLLSGVVRPPFQCDISVVYESVVYVLVVCTQDSGAPMLYLVIIYPFCIRLYYMIISSLQQPHPQYHPPAK